MINIKTKEFMEKLNSMIRKAEREKKKINEQYIFCKKCPKHRSCDFFNIIGYVVGVIK